VIGRRVAAWLAAGAVIVAFGMPLFSELGTPDFKGDEPIYAFAIDRMLDQGDWLTPKSIPRDDAAFVEKPPLKFWIVAASVRAGLLPQNEFGYRVWDVLFGIAAFLYVYAIGVQVSGIVCGLLAVLVLFAHQPLVMEHGLRTNNMEAALVLAYCGGICHALAWRAASKRSGRWVHALAVALWFAFGFMIKFVAAIFLPAILVGTAILSPSWRRRLVEDWKAWTAAAIVAAGLIVPWFVYQFHLRGREFWDIIFGQHIYERFTAFLDPEHLRPWYFYFAEMWTQFSASHALILVCAGLVVLLAQAIRERSEPAILILVWFLLPLAAISSGTSKLYHYAYPFLPPLAIGAGLVPVVVMRAAGEHRSDLERLLERVWPARRSQAIPAFVRTVLIVIAAAAVVLAALTPLFGTISLHAGGALLFRSSTISRPLLVAIVLLFALGWFRMIPLAVVAALLLVAMPFDGYRNVKRLDVQQARWEGAPMRALRTCLLGLQARGAAAGVYVHTAEPGQWRYAYYLRQPGWTAAEASDDRELAARLLTPSEERPVFLTQADYRRLREDLAAGPGHDELRRLDAVHRLVFDDARLLLLPGPYGACAGVTGASIVTGG
jgi:4-amino-4-deoxy-L-arabinose transferase-like glycosyltransferase